MFFCSVRQSFVLPALLLLSCCYLHHSTFGSSSSNSSPDDWPSTYEELRQNYSCVTGEKFIDVGDRQTFVHISFDEDKRMLLSLDAPADVQTNFTYGALTYSESRLEFDFVVRNSSRAGFPPGENATNCKDLIEQCVAIMPESECQRSNWTSDECGDDCHDGYFHMNCAWDQYVLTIPITDKDGNQITDEDGKPLTDKNVKILKEVFLTTGNIWKTERYEYFPCQIKIRFPEGYFYLAKNSELKNNMKGMESIDKCIHRIPYPDVQSSSTTDSSIQSEPTPTADKEETLYNCALKSPLFIVLWSLGIVLLIAFYAVIITGDVLRRRKIRIPLRRRVAQRTTNQTAETLPTGQTSSATRLSVEELLAEWPSAKKGQRRAKKRTESDKKVQWTEPKSPRTRPSVEVPPTDEDLLISRPKSRGSIEVPPTDEDIIIAHTTQSTQASTARSTREQIQPKPKTVEIDATQEAPKAPLVKAKKEDSIQAGSGGQRRKAKPGAKKQRVIKVQFCPMM